jgi:thiol:disulfide interchange protein DsbG
VHQFFTHPHRPFGPVHSGGTPKPPASGRIGLRYAYVGLLLALLLASARVPATESPPPALARLLAMGLKVEGHFDAPGQMTGYVMRARESGRADVVYVSSDGRYLFIGNILDETGQDLTQSHVEDHVLGPELDALWQQLESARWVTEGATKPTRIIYSFTDANCGYCHLLSRVTRHYHGAGLQVRHLMVDVIKASSTGKAAAILQAKDPSQALADNETRFREGGIAPAAQIQDETRKTLTQNRKMMDRLGISGTPAILYRDATGKVRLQRGMTDLDTLARVIGLPQQPINDPELARFKTMPTG